MDWLDFKEFIKDSFVYIATFAVVILIIVYIASFTQVVGPSMDNTLSNGDITIVSKSHYRIFKVNKGDIISFTNAGTKYLVKRVIALPGDAIEFIEGKPYVNGEMLNEPYVYDNPDRTNVLTKDFGIVPDNSYFVLGDNRDDSLDSRSSQVGFVNKDDIIGKIIFRLFPFHRMKVVK
jgi:signal peptidase I